MEGIVQIIEQVLRAQLPDRCRRLTAIELKNQPVACPSVGWRIELPDGAVACAGVDHFLVVTDAVFPCSQPRIVAPQADRNFSWPHVERAGLLCLPQTLLASDPGQRVLRHLQWAQQLLNYSEAERRSEFEREFTSYWNQRTSDRKTRPTVLSLLKPGGTSREIVYFDDCQKGCIVVADERGTLTNWLRNSGQNPGDKQILPSWLICLPRPWTPDEYPENGRDLLRLLPEHALRRVLTPDQRCPLLIGVTTQTGPAFAAVLLRGAAKKDLLKGFRSLARVPNKNVIATFGARPVQRCPVTRVDGPWVHGRDHDPACLTMHNKLVAIVGCGALGAAVARLLAQSGVGGFVLIDPDDLSPSNVARHALGMRHIGKNKAQATAQMLREDFPHLRTVTPYTSRFEKLTVEELKVVSASDLIISAGVDFDGDASLATWRRSLKIPPAHLCTWVEAFAIVGHAVLLYGADSLRSGFDEDERPSFRLTDWHDASNAMIIEAGCGNAFQPHGAVELQSTVVLAAGLAVDALLDKVPASCRRVWQGDLEAVARNGGAPRSGFTESHVVKDIPWS